MDELIEIVAWEFRRFALLHNGPLGSTGTGDDTRLVTNLNNGYVQVASGRWPLTSRTSYVLRLTSHLSPLAPCPSQNVVQRYVMGVELTSSYENECGIMQEYLGWPKPKVVSQPTHTYTLTWHAPTLIWRTPTLIWYIQVVAQPTLREANDNSLYIANNIYKVHAGNR